MIARGHCAFLILPTLAGENEEGEAMLMFSPVRIERGDARGGTYLQEEDFFDAIRWGRSRLRTGLNLHGTCHFTHSSEYSSNVVMGPGGGVWSHFFPTFGVISSQLHSCAFDDFTCICKHYYSILKKMHSVSHQLF